MDTDQYLITPLATSTPFSKHSFPHRPSSEQKSVSQAKYTRLYSDSLNPVLSNQASNSIQSHRQMIVKEIFDTEHAYISQLNTIITLFLKPIRVGCLLPQDVIRAIFSNIEAILSVNRELFSYMRQRSLVEAFTYLGPFLKLYCTYANNFQNANSVLQDWLRSDDKFSGFITSQEKRSECCGLKLASLMIIPIQRIPRYKLLLNDLLKYTRTTHTDYERLSVAATEIESVASHINEYIRQHDNFNKMLSIQNSLSGQSVPGILAPARRFIHEGRLMKICYRKARERVVFLFSDILIYAKPKIMKYKDQQRKYECRCVFPLINATVELVDEDPRAVGITKLLKVSNTNISILLYSENIQEVLDWAKIIQEAVKALEVVFASPMAENGSENLPEEQLERISPQSQHTMQLDLGTLTPRTPYPLTATLFSTLHEASAFNFDQGGLENTDRDGEGDVFIPGRSQNSFNSTQSRCCTIS